MALRRPRLTQHTPAVTINGAIATAERVPQDVPFRLLGKSGTFQSSGISHSSGGIIRFSPKPAEPDLQRELGSI